VNIGQASKASGVSERMIRHYEKIGLVPQPPRRDSGYRDYSDADVNWLRFIANARDLGFPREEIGCMLAEQRYLHSLTMISWRKSLADRPLPRPPEIVTGVSDIELHDERLLSG